MQILTYPVTKRNEMATEMAQPNNFARQHRQFQLWRYCSHQRNCIDKCSCTIALKQKPRQVDGTIGREKSTLMLIRALAFITFLGPEISYVSKISVVLLAHVTRDHPRDVRIIITGIVFTASR